MSERQFPEYPEPPEFKKDGGFTQALAITIGLVVCCGLLYWACVVPVKP